MTTATNYRAASRQLLVEQQGANTDEPQVGSRTGAVA